VTAVQSWKLASAAGVVAPSYWDVETTVWLPWAFTDVTSAYGG
jgi:hypothetical protein